MSDDLQSEPLRTRLDVVRMTSRLESKRLVLAPLGADEADLRFAHVVLTDPQGSESFRWRGSTPSFDDFVGEMLDGVRAGFVARTRRHGRRCAVSLLSSADPVNGHAFLSVVSEPSFYRTGLAAEAGVVTAAYAFDELNLRKVYAEVIASRMRDMASLARHGVEVEGIMRDHVFCGGVRHDVARLALQREVWDRSLAGLAELLRSER